MFERLKFDLSLVAAVLLLVVVGVLFIYSSGSDSTQTNEYLKQILWALTGLAVFFLVSLFDYRMLSRSVGSIYLIGLGFLAFTLLNGQEVNGARSWLGVYSLGVQPSEFMKPAAILLLANYLARTQGRLKNLEHFLKGAMMIAPTVILIALQPDLGTALVFIPLLFGLFFLAGTPLRYLFFIGGLGFGAVFITVFPVWEKEIWRSPFTPLHFLTEESYLNYTLVAGGTLFALALIGFRVYQRKYYYWICYAISLLFSSILLGRIFKLVLKDYQLKRLIIFLEPYADPRQSGWNVIQSITAIGSGGFWGKGFLRGTQSQYRFLPQQSTDFIFSIIAEEWGFAGSFLVIGLFFFIFYRIYSIGKSAKDDFGFYVTFGSLLVVFFHFTVNIGMAMGVMPVTGIPLFFLSYGGSALWTAFICLGLANSVYYYRYQF